MDHEKVPFEEEQRHKHHFPQWMLPNYEVPFYISGFSKGIALLGQRRNLIKDSHYSNMKVRFQFRQVLSDSYLESNLAA